VAPAIVIFSALMLYWIYDGYGRALRLLCLLRGPVDSSTDSFQPSVAVLLTVHNEAATVCERVRNLLASDYPDDLLEIVVASDGSTDATNELVRSMNHPRVRLVECPGGGKTVAQNLVIPELQAEVIVFTDAGVSFDSGWISKVAGRFVDPRIGAVDGRLMFGSPDDSQVSTSQGFYWRYELLLRELESHLGILAVVSGSGFAVRSSCFVPMDPWIGEDCIVPLDVVAAAFRVVHEPRAVAYDQFEAGDGVTLRRRVRMTLRNWQGTWMRSQLLNPLRHPGVAFALWSHKILRWLSPLFLLAGTMSACYAAISAPSWFSAAMLLPWLTLFGLGGFHAVFERERKLVPGSGTAFSFLLANLAFMIGVWRAILGRQVRAYRNQ